MVKLSERRLSPVLKAGTQAQSVISYLNTLGYKEYYINFKDYCSNGEDWSFHKSKYHGTFDSSKCYKIKNIYLHDKTFLTLLEGNVIYKINFDKNQKLESYSNRISWTFL